MARTTSRFSDVKVTTRNVEGVIAGLRRYPIAVRERVKLTVWEFGHEQYALTVLLAPVAKVPDPPLHPGFLKASIKLRFTRSGYGYEIGADASDYLQMGEPFYIVFQEFGTSRNVAQPCIFPAAEITRPRFQAALAHDIEAAEREAVSRRGL